MSVRPFELMVDSGDRDEPPSRYFATLDAAFVALAELRDDYRRFAWIREHVDGRVVVHARDGVRVTS